jgi:CMP/dCMP kinase
MIITISGPPGSGKTTIANALAAEFGLKYFSVGLIMRKMANEKGIDVMQINKLGEKDGSIDKALDEQQVKLGRRVKNAVFDGRLSFHFIPKSIKIMLRCPAALGARRIYSQSRNHEKYASLNLALAYIRERLISERKRYKKYYNLDINNTNHYDIILSTEGRTIPQSNKAAIAAVKKFLKTGKRVFVSKFKKKKSI